MTSVKDKLYLEPIIMITGAVHYWAPFLPLNLILLRQTGQIISEMQFKIDIQQFLAGSSDKMVAYDIHFDSSNAWFKNLKAPTAGTLCVIVGQLMGVSFYARGGSIKCIPIWFFDLTHVSVKQDVAEPHAVIGNVGDNF